MTPLFKKMNYKNQDRIVVLNHPVEFNTPYEEMKAFTKMSTRASGLLMKTGQHFDLEE